MGAGMAHEHEALAAALLQFGPLYGSWVEECADTLSGSAGAFADHALSQTIDADGLLCAYAGHLEGTHDDAGR